MLDGDTVTRDVLANLIDGAVDDTIKEQIARRAQQPPISSKIARSIEARLDRMQINGHSGSVVVQDFPDRGPGSSESKSGAKLYIDIRVEPWLKGMPSVTKVLLIQAKKERAITKSCIAGPQPKVKSADDTVSQCGKMVVRTDKGSFAWVYGTGGARVLPAVEVIKQQAVPPELLVNRNVPEYFRDLLDCFSGDTTLVAPDIFDDGANVAAVLE